MYFLHLSWRGPLGIPRGWRGYDFTGISHWKSSDRIAGHIDDALEQLYSIFSGEYQGRWKFGIWASARKWRMILAKHWGPMSLSAVQSRIYRRHFVSKGSMISTLEKSLWINYNSIWAMNASRLLNSWLSAWSEYAGSVFFSFLSFQNTTSHLTLMPITFLDWPVPWINTRGQSWCCVHCIEARWRTKSRYQKKYPARNSRVGQGCAQSLTSLISKFLM